LKQTAPEEKHLIYKSALHPCFQYLSEG